MELWIRSQGKLKLIKVNYCYIMDQQDHFTIIGETVDSGPIIATYKTKERALEVLDEIQQILCPKKPKAIIGKNVEFIPSNVYVYEMPKE